MMSDRARTPPRLEPLTAEPRYLHELLERSAERRPGDLAVIEGSIEVDYDGFLAAVRRLGDRLSAAGATPGDRVGLYLPHTREGIFSIFAVSRVGGVFVPIHRSLKPSQVRHIVGDSGARFLVTTAGAWGELRAELGDRLPCPILVGGVSAEPVGETCRETRRETGRAARRGGAEEEAGPEGLAAILYTSGSSGLPKGVMLSHANLLAGSRIVCRYLELEASDRLLSVLPLSFDYGLNQLITTVDRAATIVPLTFRFGDEIVRTLARRGITGLAGVPALWTLLTRAAPALRRTALPRLRYVTNSGGAMPPDTLSRLRQLLPDAEVVLMYGLTEAFRSTYLPAAEVDRRSSSIGRAIPETEIHVVGEDGRRCAPGEVGELVHDGPTVALGYWGRPEETAAVFRPHPFAAADRTSRRVCYSGDRVKLDDEGYLYFVGRTDAMIKSRGYRVSPTEVEEALLASAQLSAAAVIGLPDPLHGQRVHAVAVAAPGIEPLASEILADCDRQLPGYMVPRTLELVESLPRLPSGKTDYARLVAEREASRGGR